MKLTLAGAAAFFLAAFSAHAVEFLGYEAPGARGDGQILKGSDGNLFFTQASNRIGRITPTGKVNTKRIGTPQDSRVGGVAIGPNDDLWITDELAGSIGILKPHLMVPGVKATMSEHAMPRGHHPRHIVPGSDGNLWISDNARNRLLWVRGTFFIEYKIPTENSGVAAMTVGPDENLWFTESHVGKVGRAMPGGIITELVIGSPESRPMGITSGADGGVWFADPGTNSVGRIDPETLVIAVFPVPTADSAPLHLTAGTDGNVWYTSARGNIIGRVTPQGVVTEFPLLKDVNTIEAPGAITRGYDGNLWFLANGKIGVVTDAAFVAPPALHSVFSFELAKHVTLETANATTIVVKRSGNTTTTASIHYLVNDISAVSGTNYVANTGKLVFAPDEVSKIVTIPILDDNADSGEKSFKVKLSNPSENAALGPTPETTVTITDINSVRPDDEPATTPTSGTLSAITPAPIALAVPTVN